MNNAFSHTLVTFHFMLLPVLTCLNNYKCYIGLIAINFNLLHIVCGYCSEILFFKEKIWR